MKITRFVLSSLLLFTNNCFILKDLVKVYEAKIIEFLMGHENGEAHR